MTASTFQLQELVEPDRPVTYGIVKPGPDTPGGVPYVRVVDMQDGRINTEGLRRTTEELAASYRRSALRAGDLLISIRGHVGRMAFVPPELEGANITQDTARLSLGKRCNSNYIRWYITSPTAQRWMAERVRGVAVTGINLADLRELPIPLPPLPEQKRIAAMLDKADAIRRKRQEAIRLTEELLRSAFLEMCGPNAKAYSKWPERSVEQLAAQEKGSMRTGPFGSDLRHSEFVDEGVAVLGIDNAVKNRFAWDERRFISEEKYERLRRYTVFPGDVIVTIMGTTGRSAVVPDDIPMAITTKHLATITLNRQLAEPEFVSQALHRHPEVLAQVFNAHRGAIMSGLNLGLIKSLVVRTPPIEVQREFTKLTAAVRRHEAMLTAAADEPLTECLMQQAFTGRL